MTLEMFVVLVLVVVAVILFASERYPVDLVALMLMGFLLLTGIVTAEEGIAGFSNTATVTVGAMFILSAGLFRTGTVDVMGKLVVRLFHHHFWIAIGTTMIVVGSLSAFINNTPVVAIFIPIMLGVAGSIKKSASKLLMPLSFAAMFGGVCTLIGTSTNILVSSIAERYGQPAFSMFEFSSLGLIFLGVGVTYMVFVGIRLIPNRRPPGELTENFGMGEYLTEIILGSTAKSVGKKLSEAPLAREVGVQILEVIRDGKNLRLPPSRTVLEEGDILRVVGNVEKIKALQEREGIKIKPGMKWHDTDFESAETQLVEAIVAPNSSLEGKTLKESRFRNSFRSTVLAIRHRGKLMRENVGDTKLHAGDTLLVEVRKDQLDRLKEDDAFVFVSEVGLPTFRKKKMIPAVVIVAGVVAASALGIVPIVIGAVVGSVLLVLVGCITLEEAYRSIDWKVIFLLAGALTLGAALEKTGAANFIANLLISATGTLGPVAIVAGLYLLTSLMTEAMSNNATAALLAPIAIVAADSMGVDPRPFLMAVAFAASASFMTPVGYQTNTMIYGVGQYKFVDFLKVGAPLNLIFWILATIFIPIFWPF